MNETLENLCTSLEELAVAIEKGWTDARTLNEVHGWQFPAVTKEDLAFLPLQLASRIRNSGLDLDNEDLIGVIEDIPRKLELLKSKTVPQFYGGNGVQAIPAFITTIQYIYSVLGQELTWVATDPKSMPPAVSRRLQGLSAKIDQIDVDQEKLNEQITLINNATETAESLPADLEDLKKARQKVDTISDEVIKASTKVSSAKEEIDKLLDGMRSDKVETDKLVENCGEAYRITTSKGLAGAFDKRASQLSWSKWIWVIGLICSLTATWFVGSERIEILTKVLSDPDTQFGLAVIHFLLAFIGLGAPLWFAWLSTKQIGQNFKLAEDYGFKASVAKAYEGYRREAVRIDPDLEARLFESALNRVEEAPLRFLEQNDPNTPWFELVDSSEFKQAFETIPDFKDKLVKLVQSDLAYAKNKKKENDEDQE